MSGYLHCFYEAIMGIGENVAARRHVIDLLSCRELDSDLFWLTMQEHVNAIVEQRCPKQSLDRDQPMDNMEATVFERAWMPWGKHAGVPVGEVPLDYLLAITESDFGTKMKRYLRSDLFAARQEEVDAG